MRRNVTLLSMTIFLAARAAMTSEPPLRLNLRVTKTAGTERAADTKFSLGLTFGISVVQKDGFYYLNGGTHQRRAWNSWGTTMWDLVFVTDGCPLPDCINMPPSPNCGNAPNWNPCDYRLDPRARPTQ